MNRRSAGRTTWKVGELAREAGVSVRTLHHYEEVGVLPPPDRTAAGHRVYGVSHVERLARVRALAALGLSLAEVKDALEAAGSSPLELVERHLARAKERLQEEQSLVARLEAVRSSLKQEGTTVEQLLATVEVMTMIEKYYSAEQLEQLEDRRHELGPDGMAKAEAEWAQLFVEVKAAMDAGEDPMGTTVQRLRERWDDLVGQFTGGDPGIAASLQKMYEEAPVERVHASFDPELFAFMAKARGGGS